MVSSSKQNKGVEVEDEVDTDTETGPDTMKGEVLLEEELEETTTARSLGGGAQEYYDGTGFFSYNDIYDWSNAAISVQSCYES